MSRRLNLRPIRTRRLREHGSAILVVLLALALLFSLGVPFLFTGRERSVAARESFDRARARIAVASASSYSDHIQAGSHPSIDPTPYWDEANEWDLSTIGPLPQSLEGGWSSSRESWGMEIQSGQARISLATAPPMLLQNLLHPCFITEDATFEDSELQVTSTNGFPDEGFLLIGATWVEYGSKTATTFNELRPADPLPNDLEAVRIREGWSALDQRVVNLALARLQSGEHQPPEFFHDLMNFNFGDPTLALLPEEERRRLEELTWLSTGAFGAEQWLPATYIERAPTEENPEFVMLGDANTVSPGSIVRINIGGVYTFDSLVYSTSRNGCWLPIGLPSETMPWVSSIAPLRREPVDINACDAEILEALVLGLRFRGAPPVVSDQPPSGMSRRHYINRGKARNFATDVMNARPLQGPEDLWRRVLEPAVDRGRLSHVDAWLIMLNGLEPNNGYLAASTTGFAYRSGDRYLQRVNAALRSRLGNTMARGARFLDHKVAPTGLLMQVWETQRDFEEAGRYNRGLHRVASMPNNRGNLGGHSDWTDAIGLTHRIGAWPSTGLLSESTEKEDSALMPKPAVETFDYQPGRIEHFDLEPSPLGWDIAERGPLISTIEDYNLSISDSGGSDHEPLVMQGWFEMPRDAVSAAGLMEISGDYVDRQRITSSIEEGKVVVRAYDNAGDDPNDEDGLEQALTTEIDLSEYPIQNRWFHLNMLLRSVAPGGMQVAVDGVPRGNTLGRTKLTQAVSGYAPGDTDLAISVESTEGFPTRGALRIGNEVIEYSAKTDTSFTVSRMEGTDSYIGGRAAREPSDDHVNILDSDHPVGAGVEIYGYSAPLTSDIPPGGSTVAGAVGPWSVAVGLEGPDTINLMALNGVSFSIGTGISGGYLGPVELTTLVPDDPYYAEAFQETGGLALIVQRSLVDPDTDNYPIGGFEVVRYSGRTGTTINLAERGVVTPRMADWPNGGQGSSGHSFVFEWEEWIYSDQLGAWFESPEMRVFILPISIGGADVSDLRYLLPDDDNSEFVQITHPEDAGLTEWVRYDSIYRNYFVRDDWNALRYAVIDPLLRGDYTVDYDLPSEPPGGGGGGGGGSGGSGAGGGAGGTGGSSGGGMMDFYPQDGEQISHMFVRRIGEDLDDRDELISDISQRFQFRGVMGTFEHAHEGGEELVPVIQTWRPVGESPNAGYVGRLDRVAIMDPSSTNPPMWYTVQWGTAPFPFQDERLRYDRTYLAFDTSTQIPFAMSNQDDVDNPSTDVRDYLRLCKFPSGERPRNLHSVFVGTTSNGQGGVFGGMVDELVLAEPPGMGRPGGAITRACLALREDLGPEEQDEIRVDPNFVVRDGQSIYGSNPGQWLEMMPEAGLIEIDGERIAYNGIDPSEGVLEIAPNGRGLHGTEPAGHASGAKAWAADSRPYTFLMGDVSPTEATLQVEASTGMAGNSLLLIDEELIHTPIRPHNNALEMPRFDPPEDDPNELGDGMLRGRFGTTPASHSGGTLVYSFPNRWMDLYAPRGDHHALGWFQLGLNEPGAYWDGVLMETEEPDTSHRIRVLARSGPAKWTDDPESTPGLVLIERPAQPSGDAMPLHLQNDQLDLRVSFDWGVGSFDPVTFAATAWTVAPRLRHLRLQYYAETKVIRQEDIFE
jgi:hypothetical protein